MALPSVAVAAHREPKEGNFLSSFSLKAQTPGKHLAFGLVQIFARGLAKDKKIDVMVALIVRGANYRNPKRLRWFTPELAAR